MNYNYSVYSVLIPAKSIINLCGPDRINDNEYTKKMVSTRNNKDFFYSKLEKHILGYGIKNPIIVSIGFCPKSLIKFIPEDKSDDYLNYFICDRHGGSRLYIAQKHNLLIPCIVNDFNNFFSDKIKELRTVKDISAQFVDKPKKIIHNEEGIHIVDLPQIQLT
jgi:hypothetical protein